MQLQAGLAPSKNDVLYCHIIPYLCYPNDDQKNKMACQVVRGNGHFHGGSTPDGLIDGALPTKGSTPRNACSCSGHHCVIGFPAPQRIEELCSEAF